MQISNKVEMAFNLVKTTMFKTPYGAGRTETSTDQILRGRGRNLSMN